MGEAVFPRPFRRKRLGAGDEAVTVCYVRLEHTLDLFGNPIGSRTSLAFFRAKAG